MEGYLKFYVTCSIVWYYIQQRGDRHSSNPYCFVVSQVRSRKNVNTYGVLALIKATNVEDKLYVHSKCENTPLPIVIMQQSELKWTILDCTKLTPMHSKGNPT